MMRTKLMIAVTGVAIGFSMLGCSNNLQTENTLLKKENEELRAQYKELTMTFAERKKICVQQKK